MEILLAFLGAFLIYFLQSRLYKKMWNKGLKVTVSIKKDVVVEGDSNQLVEVIENRKILPLLMLRVKFSIDHSLKFEGHQNISVTDKCYKNDIFSVMFYQKITRNINFDCTKRGLFIIDRINLVSVNLLMLDHLVENRKCNIPILVYPRYVDIERLKIPFNKMMGNILTKRYSYEDPFEFRGIRDYGPDDPMKNLNWKASAKTGELKVNTHNYTSRQEVCILLNFDADKAWIDDLLFEESIAIANTLCEMFVSKGVPVSIISNGYDILTRERLSLPGGSSQNHLTLIKESLSRLDYTKDVNPLCNYIAGGIGDENTLRVLISKSSRYDITEAFASLSEKGNEVVFINPYRANMDTQGAGISIPNCDVIPWEVS